MYTLKQRVNYFNNIFEYLQDTSSRNEKIEIIESIPDELKDDWDAILEALNGRMVFGYKVLSYFGMIFPESTSLKDPTIRKILELLLMPKQNGDLSTFNICHKLGVLNTTSTIYDVDLVKFIQPIVDRELKLGIGNSLLDKSFYAPMLAKKYEGNLNFSKSGFYITEKLDGNRCIAFYDFTNNKWNFMSRNGKPMYVDFNMEGLPKRFIYDGEVLSKEQVELSNSIYKNLGTKFNSAFNNTSGIINRHTYNKDLIYNIFDIQYNVPYCERRQILDSLKPTSDNVRILPILKMFESNEKYSDAIDELLYKVTSVGGEGIMINIGDASYINKRTNNLLKYKEVKTMDMLVRAVYTGEGKYLGQVGGLLCESVLENGSVVICNVGTGLSDEQRFEWSLHPDHIVGKIVEIAYFSLSQNNDSIGSNTYSLRFPRLIKIRNDKYTTSEY